jgi:hypothetical protein
MAQTMALDCAILNWDVAFESHGSSRKERVAQVALFPSRILTELARNGVAALGHELDSSRVVVSIGNDFQFGTDKLDWKHRRHPAMVKGCEIWKETIRPEPERRHFKAQTGNITPAIPLETILEALESAMTSTKPRRYYNTDDELPDVVFVAEINTKTSSKSPESPIARVWNECLGQKAIPFDPVERQALIEQGRRHHELKIHIEAWEELKRTASAWTKSRG